MKQNDWEQGGQEVQSNWFKFEKVGDFIKGTLVSRERKEGQGDFGPQWVYELQKEDGEVWNVGISESKSGTIARLRNCKIGDIIGIKYDSDGKAPKKGFHAPKNLVIKSWGADPNYDAMSGGENVMEEAMDNM